MKLSGVLAWHPEVAMSKEEIDEFLSGRWVARLATIGPDGYPYVAPFWYYWDGGSLYLALAKSRRSYKDLAGNPRCSIVIDMDDRPLLGMRSNMARAVQITGEAEMAEVGTGQKVTIDTGPWRGEYTAEHAVALVDSRYLLFSRDGALGVTGESFFEMITSKDARDSQLLKDNEGRVLTKIRPKKLRGWDFSKAPIAWVS